ncbi:MAG: MoxR family ATPase [Spirochaetales bacterium]|nr:MoxR family ATPase [Spirochaetales bacterium]
MQSIKEWASGIIANVEKVFLGKAEVIEKVLVALLSGGHILLEDIPGVGKTILARALSASIDGKFRRIQCTPDLLPTDILGVSVYNPKTGEFDFRNGPVMSNLLLVDEINRATPRTQSALLEAMAEGQISVEGRQVLLPDPFFLVATENPIEFEGTFPLPEAQKDRFLMCLKVGYPSRETEAEILQSQRTTSHPITGVKAVASCADLAAYRNEVVNIFVDPEVYGYILDIVEASRNHTKIRLGVSPRGTLALFRSGQALAALRGRDFVLPEDIKELAPHVLNKRITISSEQLIRGVSAENIIADILDQISVPLVKDRI